MLDYTNTELHFKLLKEIGAEGKNSSVFTAHDYQLDAEIVVKKINKPALTKKRRSSMKQRCYTLHLTLVLYLFNIPAKIRILFLSLCPFSERAH